MAGHAHVKIQDAAIERQSFMREEQYKHFRWTRQTVRSSMWGVVLVPVGLFLLVRANQNQWDWTAKRKDQPLAKS